MKKAYSLLLLFFIIVSASAHRIEVDILDTEARKAVLLSKLGFETVRFDHDKGLSLLEKAHQEANNVQDVRLRELALATIANDLAGVGETSKAIAIAKGLSDVHLYVTSLGKIAGKVYSKDMALAESLLKDAVKKTKDAADKQEKPALLGEIAGKYLKIGQAQMARQLIKEAREMLDKVKWTDPVEQVSTYAEVAANLLATGDKDGGFQLFDKAYQNTHKIVDDFQKAAALSMLGGEYAEKGQPERSLVLLEEAFLVAQKITDKQKRDDINSEIARNFSQARNFKKAIDISIGINDPYFASEGLIRTAKNHFKLKQEEQAYYALALVKEKANAISHVEKKAMIIAKSASELVVLGRIDEARIWLEEALVAVM